MFFCYLFVTLSDFMDPATLQDTHMVAISQTRLVDREIPG